MTETNNLVIRDKDLGEPESFVIPKNKKFAKKAKKAGFILSFIIYQLVLFVIFYLVVNVNSIIMAFKDGPSFALGKTKFKANYEEIQKIIDIYKKACDAIGDAENKNEKTLEYYKSFMKSLVGNYASSSLNTKGRYKLGMLFYKKKFAD